MAYPNNLVRTKNWGTEVLTDSDLEGQLDLIINWAMASLDSSTGHTHDGTSNQGPKIPIANLTVASQALGDTFYASSATVWTRLAGNTTTTRKVLSQVGTGSVSAAPTWFTLPVIQVVNTTTGAVATGSTTVPFDDTIPQNTEGDQYMSLAITPTVATNALRIDVVLQGAFSLADSVVVALFQDSTANALAAMSQNQQAVNQSCNYKFTHYMTAGTTSATTFKVRAGGATGGQTFTFNGTSAARKLGGVMASSITITEIGV